jgi:tetratricopeptide (TPR) repeat protein
MSEQANTYQKFRDADDDKGNMAWSRRVASKALRCAPEAPKMLEKDFEMAPEERVIWRLLRIPREFVEIVDCGVLNQMKTLAIIRGLVSADCLDIVESDEAKPIVPLEIKRLKIQLGLIKDTGKKKKRRIQFPPKLSQEGSAASSATGAPVSAEPAPAAPITEKDPEVVQAVEAAHEAAKSATFYELLGIAQNVGAGDIKKAFFAKVKLIHPDSVGTGVGNDPELLKKAQEAFAAYNKAMEELSDPRRRNAYDDALKSGTARPALAEQGKIERRPEEAKVHRIKGGTFLHKGNFDEAERELKLAMRFDPEDPQISTLYAWCIYQNPARSEKDRMVDARKRLQEITDKYKYAEACYRLALIARDNNQDGEAKNLLKRTLELDPKHGAARQERQRQKERKARLQERRAKESTGGSGLLSKFLGTDKK